MDPISLVLNALVSGAAQGSADSISNAVKSAYTRLTQLVSDKFSGNRSAEVVLAEHAADPETWQAPLAKALTASGVVGDQAIIDAAQQLMALLDQAGTAEGKYHVDLRDAQGVQVGDGNQPYNTFNSVTPTIVNLVDLSVFGRTRRTQLGDLSVGVTTPLGVSAEKIGSLVRQALITMANDFGFTAADTARI